MAHTTSYVDIGAVQRQEGGGGTAQTSYVDIGAAQRQDAGGGGGDSSSLSRKMRLFEGFRIKFVSGRLKLLQQSVMQFFRNFTPAHSTTR